MKLKGLYSKSSLSMTLSEDSGLEGSKSVLSGVTSSTARSHFLEDMSRDEKSSDSSEKYSRNKFVNNVSSDDDVKMSNNSSSFDSNANNGVRKS